MIFSHKGLKVGGGDVAGPTLMSAPLREEAVGDATKHSQHPQGIITLHPRSVIVVGNIQTLVQTAFNAPTLSVKQQPELGWEQ